MRPSAARAEAAAGEVIARRSPLAVAFMGWYFERFVRRHLGALRLARWGAPDLPPSAGPLIIYCNHPTWWEPAVCFVLRRHLFPRQVAYAPIEAAMLAKYRVFRRLGGIGIDLETPRGAATFLRTGAEVLSRPDRALWVTAQGRFTDARARPLGLRPGIARLAEVAPDAWFVPLALEYVFWTERGAEALAAFGEPRRAADLAALDRPERLTRLEQDLTRTLDRLAVDAIAREPARFTKLVAGRSGIGGVYDLWRRAKAAFHGHRFDPSHQEPAR